MHIDSHLSSGSPVGEATWKRPAGLWEVQHETVIRTGCRHQVIWSGVQNDETRMSLGQMYFGFLPVKSVYVVFPKPTH